MSVVFMLQYVSTAVGHLQDKKYLKTNKRDVYNCVLISNWDVNYSSILRYMLLYIVTNPVVPEANEQLQTERPKKLCSIFGRRTYFSRLHSAHMMTRNILCQGYWDVLSPEVKKPKHETSLASFIIMLCTIWSGMVNVTPRPSCPRIHWQFYTRQDGLLCRLKRFYEGRNIRVTSKVKP